MIKCFDFQCTKCEEVHEEFQTPEDAAPVCSDCGAPTERLFSKLAIFTTIVPITKTSQNRKAGYVHKFVNRPAEKISVSVPAQLKPSK